MRQNNMMSCRICNHVLTDSFLVKEMMYGTGELFGYYQCLGCGSIQIKDIPDNLHKYYPSNYHKNPLIIPFFILQYARWLRDRYSYNKKGRLGKMIENSVGKNHNSAAFAKLTKKISFDESSVKILDVGCGNGGFVYFLYKLGYKNVLGIDPFIESKEWNKNVKLQKNTVYDVADKFDLIVSNHSLEHVPNFLNDFKQIISLLDDGGFFFLRIPVAGLGFDMFKENWVQIDAPRHITVPSFSGLKLVCEQLDIKIIDYFYDTTELLFVGSELYRRGLSLEYKKNFSKTQLSLFEKKAEELNRNNSGDQICLIIQK